MKRLRSLLPPIGIFALALLVRVVYNLTAARNYYPLHDSLAYQTLAFNLLDEHCYCLIQGVTVNRAPLWPFIIAGLSLVSRANIIDRLFLCVADAGTCVLIYYLARDLFGKRVGLVAGLVACVYPALYIYTGWMYTESLFTFLQAAICYCVLRIQRSHGRSRRLWILCGVLLGLISLTRPNGVLAIGLVVVWTLILVWRQKLPREALLNVVLATLVGLAVIAPWTVRNYVVSHSFVLVADADGTVLNGVYNNYVLTIPRIQGGWYSPAYAKKPSPNQPVSVDHCSAPCEVKGQSAETADALRWIKNHLNDIPIMMVYRLRNFFTAYTDEADMPLNRFEYQRSTRLVLRMSETIPYAIFAAAAVGLVVTLRRYWQELLFAYLVILGTLGVILAFYGNARFRSPIEPLLILLGAGALWWLTESQPGTRRWARSHGSGTSEKQSIPSVSRGLHAGPAQRDNSIV